MLPTGVVANAITAGPDRNLWFKDTGDNLVGQITTSGAIGLFQTDGQGLQPGNIVAGPDGRIWFTLENKASVAAFEPFQLAAAAPDVQDVSPRSGPTSGGTKVMITGSSIGSATKVLFGSNAASFKVTGPGEIEAVAPAHAAGKVNVVVVTPAGRTDVTDASRFYYTSAACGRTITRSTTLSADIGPCYDDGVVIGADGITLDLGGHKVYNFVGPSDGSAAGVRMPRRTGVTVKNGTIAGFDAGIVVRGGGSNVLTGLTLQDNVGPDDIPSAEFGDGIFVEDSAGNRIVANTLSHNGRYDGIGIFGPDADGNTVANNVVEYTVGPSDHQPAGEGIITNGAAGDGSPTFIDSNRVENNVVRYNGSGGIANVNTVQGVVVGNTVVGNGQKNSFGNGIGLSVGGNWNNGPTQMLIEDNQVHGNGVDGIRIGNPVGFATGNPTGNRILNNDAADNNANPAIDTYEFGRPGYDLHDRNDRCADNVWSNNTWGTGGYM
ncbi:MAG: right-handed parallel beta-helix repeat-containing protein, partial [Actinobacteria bacterium]|nr:right-handed parallel beta-helix repeat-containing protein [Actinomycetota bacterium]